MNLDDVLTELSRDPFADHDIAEIALHLAREEYPRIDVAAYLDQLRDMARDARSHIGGDVAEQVRGLSRYLFHEVGFHGNAKDYYDPRNSYLSDVLDRLTGIPITLSLVTIAVGQRLGLPLAGVGLPGHFVVGCESDPDLFLDPFHGGRQLTLEQCHALVTRVAGAEISIAPLNLSPVPTAHFVRRMLNNLRGIYIKARDPRRASRILWRLHQIAPDDVQVRRDLGLCLVQMQRHGPALDHLGAYLAAAPDAEDAEAIQALWRATNRELGRWN